MNDTSGYLVTQGGLNIAPLTKQHNDLESAFEHYHRLTKENPESNGEVIRLVVNQEHTHVHEMPVLAQKLPRNPDMARELNASVVGPDYLMGLFNLSTGNSTEVDYRDEVLSVRFLLDVNTLFHHRPSPGRSLYDFIHDEFVGAGSPYDPNVRVVSDFDADSALFEYSTHIIGLSDQ